MYLVHLLQVQGRCIAGTCLCITCCNVCKQTWLRHCGQSVLAGRDTNRSRVDAYRVLQGVLSSCISTSNKSNSLNNTKATELALNSTFQQALLLCAVELTNFCITGSASFPAITTRLGHCSEALEIWEATCSFLSHLPTEPGVELPESVSSYLLFMRVRITEQLAWKAGSSIYHAICAGGGGSNITGDYCLLSNFLDCVSHLATSRTRATATVIAASMLSEDNKSSFANDSDWLIELVLNQHLDLLFGQHLSNIVACCIYCIVRVHHGAVSFKKIVDSMLQIFPHHALEDFKQAELQQATADSDASVGNTRQLYNVLFLPRVEQALYAKFANMQGNQNNTPRQDNAGSFKAASKQEVKARRPPLHSVSATDLNVRAGKFRKMQE